MLIMLIIHVECKNKLARDVHNKIRDSNGGRPTGPAPRNNACWSEIEVGSSQTCNNDNLVYGDYVADLSACTSIAEENDATHIYWQPDVNENGNYCQVYPTCETPYRSPAFGGQNLQLLNNCTPDSTTSTLVCPIGTTLDENANYVDDNGNTVSCSVAANWCAENVGTSEECSPTWAHWFFPSKGCCPQQEVTTTTTTTTITPIDGEETTTAETTTTSYYLIPEREVCEVQITDKDECIHAVTVTNAQEGNESQIPLVQSDDLNSNYFSPGGWSWVPPSCSVEEGSWTIHLNERTIPMNPGSPYGDTYIQVCKRNTIDCVGSWSTCSENCIKEFSVETTANSYGEMCDATDGETRVCSDGEELCQRSEIEDPGNKPSLLPIILGIAAGVFFALIPCFIIFAIAKCRKIPPDECWTTCGMKWLCCCLGFGYLPVVCWEGFTSRVILACCCPCYTVCCWTPVELTTKSVSNVQLEGQSVI